jgi:uncharacterized protein (TIGR02099 family)
MQIPQLSIPFAMLALKKTLRWCLYLCLLLATLILIAAAIIRFAIFPNINQYKGDIADYASKSMQRKVSIGQIDTGWQGLSPRVTLKNVNIYDEQNRPALLLSKIDTELSWLSIMIFNLRLSELTAYNPELTIRRSKDNIFYVAGINISGRGNPAFANWLISQSKVAISNANITYIDELRAAPALSLHNLNLTVTNSAWRSIFGRHQFTVEALPSVGSAYPIKVDGHFFGKDINKLDTWRGVVNCKLKDTDLSVWKAWLDYPVQLSSGKGNTDTQIEFANNTVERVEANVKLNNVAIQSKSENTPLVAEYANGTIAWSDLKQTQTISAKQLNLKLNTGLEIKNATGSFSSMIKDKKKWIKANTSIDELRLDALQKTADYFDIPKLWSDYMTGLSATGKIKSLNASLAGNPQQLSEYSVQADIDGLSILPYQKIPGISNLTASINANQKNGEITFNSKNTTLDIKDFLRWPIANNTITGTITWDKRNESHTIVAVDNFYISNPDLTGTLNANFEHDLKKGDYLDLTGNFEKVDAKSARFYYPSVLGEDTKSWLDKSILDGQLDDVQLTIKGDLAKFPFADAQGKPDPKQGIFKTSALIKNGKLEYGNGWPMIEDLKAQMVFEGSRMEINASEGRILGTHIINSKAVIPQLDADKPVLISTSDAQGPVAEGIKFVNNSPVKRVTMGFTDNLKTAGNANLHLELLVPLDNADDTEYKGTYQISNGTLFADTNLGMPELSQLNGTLNINSNGVTANNVSTYVVGGPAQFNLKNGPNKAILIEAKGHATDVGIKKFLDLPLILSATQGSADWSGQINITKPLANISIKSNMVGMALNAPAPFNKPAGIAKSFTFEKVQTIANADTLKVKYDGLATVNLERIEKNNNYEITRGEISINTPPQAPTANNIHISAKLGSLDGDAWLDYFDQYNNIASVSSSSIDKTLFNQADINVDNLKLFSRQIKNLKAVAEPTSTGFKMNIQSDDIVGRAEWLNANNGKIIANLSKLTIPPSIEGETSEKTEIRKLNQQYPALDINAENFEFANKKLGKLSLNAYEAGDSWIIQKLNIQSPNSTLQAEGTWHNWLRNPNTFLSFELKSSNIGKTLVEYGQPDVIKNGKATLKGAVQWPGSPHQFDTAGLNGNLTLDAKDGQIVKVQPGVGRLLGLLSLQSLPRRLTLDFRDLFSDGFAFDQIKATATSTNGVLRSNDFFMTGPAAETNIQGETNLKTETQNLNVKVRPHISDSLSLAALAGGPIAGAVAFVAQKLLKDPLNKIVSTEYNITGTWDNPQEVESSKEKKERPKSSPLEQ